MYRSYRAQVPALGARGSSGINRWAVDLAKDARALDAQHSRLSVAKYRCWDYQTARARRLASTVNDVGRRHLRVRRNLGEERD